MREHIKLCKTTDPKMMKMWTDICMEQQHAHDDWIAKLRDMGITACHPDDGWVDRKEDRVTFCYPGFDDGIKKGVLVALGNPEEHRIVRLIKHIPGFLGPGSWKFEAVEEV